MNENNGVIHDICPRTARKESSEILISKTFSWTLVRLFSGTRNAVLVLVGEVVVVVVVVVVCFQVQQKTTTNELHFWLWMITIQKVLLLLAAVHFHLI